MRHLLLLPFALAVLGCLSSEAQLEGGHAHESSGHDDGHKSAILMVQTEPATPSTGVPVALKLMIHDSAGTMVSNFDTLHEKRVHLILVREGLDEFAHVHPVVDEQGNLTVTHEFAKAGKYHLFADYKPTGKAASVARAEMVVSGEPSPPPGLTVNVPGQVIAEGFQVEVELQNEKAGEEAEIRFRLSDETGQPIDDLQPYLGARGHLVVLSADGKQYVHAHPLSKHTADNEVIFRSHFPGTGLYKGWAQFQQKDKVRTIPFVLQVP
ncbi:MAG: hypothetical protein SH868_00735 [Bythopirellula sp.]|nr:hypothetical protein [Bythopirellula sp.]